MKKTLSLIGFSFALLLSINAYTGKVYDSAIGSKAPELKLADGDNLLKLSDMRGRYVLLNFWSSTDAESRIAVQEYDKTLNELDPEQIEMVSVNFDRSRRMFQEIVRLDELNQETQHHVNGNMASEIKRSYELSDGFKSFLIDREGRIVAVNPTKTTLTEVSGI